MPARVVFLYRYPVKALAPEPLSAATLAPAAGILHDRRFAIARESTSFDPAAAHWLPRNKLVVLLTEAALARFGCRFDEETETLELTAGSAPPVRAEVATATGRGRLDDFLNATLAGTKHGRVRLIESGSLSFTDIPANCLSLINLETIRDLELKAGAPLHRLRFRANVYVEGLAAWEEMAWLGREVALGGARIRIASPIPRCATTHVNPETADRDVNVLKALKQGYGHHNLGVYAEVVSGGRVALGDALRVAGDAAAPSRLARWSELARFWGRNGVKFLRRR